MIALNENGTPQLNTVHHCRAEALLSALDTASVDLVVTSPPYDNLRTYNGFSWNFEYIAQQSYRVLKQGGVLVWVVGDATVNGSESLTSFKQAIHFVEVAGFRLHDTMIDFDRAIRFPDPTRYGQCFEYMFVFSKGRPKAINLLSEPNKTAGDRGRNTKSQREPDGSLTMKPRIPVHDVQVLRNVWEISSGYMKSTADKIAYEHPAIMDERISERHILTWSNPGDLVLDFFAGSGTTLKMARMAGRDYLGSELNADYIAIASDRLRLPFEARRMIHNGDVSDLPLFAQVPA